MSDPVWLAPVLAGEPRYDETGMAIDADRRTVRVEGDPGRLRAVLEDCDGLADVSSLAARHGDWARELLEGLLATGALVPAERGWLRFHHASANPTRLAELPDAPDPPPPPGRGAPVTLEPSGSALRELARRRRSARPDDEPHAPSFAEISELLACALGPTDSGRLTVPSGGGMYPTRIHLIAREPLGPLEPGLWRLDPDRGRLELQRPGEPALDPCVAAHPVTDLLVARRHPVIALSSDLRRTSLRYGLRGYRLALAEIGAVMQNAYLAGAELGVPVRAVAGFYDTALGELLELEDGEIAQLLLLTGA